MDGRARIVCGVAISGSPAAVGFAAAEAVRTGCVLHLVHVRSPLSIDVDERVARAGREAALAVVPGVDVTTELIEDDWVAAALARTARRRPLPGDRADRQRTARAGPGRVDGERRGRAVRGARAQRAARLAAGGRGHPPGGGDGRGPGPRRGARPGTRRGRGGPRARLRGRRPARGRPLGRRRRGRPARARRPARAGRGQRRRPAPPVGRAGPERARGLPGRRRAGPGRHATRRDLPRVAQRRARRRVRGLPPARARTPAPRPPLGHPRRSRRPGRPAGRDLPRPARRRDRRTGRDPCAPRDGARRRPRHPSHAADPRVRAAGAG